MKADPGFQVSERQEVEAGGEGKKSYPRDEDCRRKRGKGCREESIQKVRGGKRMLDRELSDQGHHRRRMREGKEPFQRGSSCGAYVQWNTTRPSQGVK